MGFTELVKEGASTASVPEEGIVLGCRKVARGDGSTRYLAVKVGKKLAAELGCHLSEQGMSVSMGHGQDAGKMAVSLNAASKFTAKKQTAGHYMLTVTGTALLGHLDLDFGVHVVEKARFVPATGNNGPMAIIALPIKSVS